MADDSSIETPSDDGPSAEPPDGQEDGHSEEPPSGEDGSPAKYEADPSGLQEQAAKRLDDLLAL